jgi:ATP-dependent RNA helicase DDX42
LYVDALDIFILFFDGCHSLHSLVTVGSVLIFVTRKTNSIELAENLEKQDSNLGLLHGDMSQVERNDIISRFRKNDFPVLVATDVAARGLDIPSIKTVVNYDVARDIDTHIHRIGRTGRAGKVVSFSMEFISQFNISNITQFKADI